ncbi:MAG: hypothetical protein QOE93_2293, partial [Actinomycetota bacterium]|nr:hypothetical protein [Actinomycetota bacterium]
MIAPPNRSVEQLAEVLASLAASLPAAEAAQGAVERIAECFEAEVGAVVEDGAIVASIGFRTAGPLPPALIDVASGRASRVDVPGAGACFAVVVPVPSETPRQLVLARSGDDGFSLEEVSLLRSIGRILATAFEMLHLRDRVAASESRFRRIVETANEGIWLLNVDGGTTFANEKMAEILGYGPEDMPASIFDVVDEDGRPHLVRNLDRRRRGLSDQLECSLLRKDGSHVWVMLNASPLYDGDATFAGSLCMISDISPRKRIEDVLLQTTARFRLLQEMATSANEASGLEEVLQVAVDGICDHTGWATGHAYLPAPDPNDGLVALPIWHLDDPDA